MKKKLGAVDNQCYRVLTCLSVLSLLYSGFVFLSSLGTAVVFFREQTAPWHWVIWRTWEADRGRDALSHQDMMLVCHWDQACLRSFQVIHSAFKWGRKGQGSFYFRSFFFFSTKCSLHTESLPQLNNLHLTKEEEEKKKNRNAKNLENQGSVM